MNTRITTIMIGGCVLVSGLAMASPPETDREAEIRRTLRQASDATGVDLEAALFGPVDRPSRREQVETRLNRFDEMDLPVRPDGPAPATYAFDVVLDGELVRVNGVQHSLRAPNVKFLADRGGGRLEAIDPGPVRTYRGQLAGEPDSQVGFTLGADGISAHIRRGDAVWRTEPLGDPAQGELAPHAVYRPADVRFSGGRCGNGPDMLVADPPPLAPPPAPGGAEGGVAGSTIYVAEIAFDVDWEYYSELALNNLDSVWNTIVSRLNEVNMLYEDELDITHVLTAIIVRTSSSDPYSTTSSNSRLDQLRTQWESQHTDIQRDLAHLMTGVNLDGTDIGLAWEGGISTDDVTCAAGSFAYGLTQTIGLDPVQVWTTVAHEIGHNWGACHCDDSSCANPAFSDCAIMDTSLLDPPPTTFLQFSRDQILAVRDNEAACILDTCSAGCCGSVVYADTSSEMMAEVASASCGSVIYGSGTYCCVTSLGRAPGATGSVTIKRMPGPDGQPITLE